MLVQLIAMDLRDHEMKHFHKRKYRKLILLTLVSAIFLLFLYPGQLLERRKGPKVTAFVVDSASSMIKKERNMLDLFTDITHGQVVTAVLRRYGQPDELHFYDVDNMRGAVDSERYLHVLTTIRSYLRARKGDRVVVNISLGSHFPKPAAPEASFGEIELITDILELGAIVVAAAGNDGTNESTYPAVIDGVICVGASANGIRRDYSNYGSVDIFADGSFRTAQTVNLPSDIGMESHSRTVELNGTSFAAPKVSGVIVKMLRLDPFLENQQVLEILQKTSDEVLGFERGSMNRLNALAAISDKYSILKKSRQIFFILLQGVCILIFVFVCSLLIVPIPEFLFRVLLPERWMAIKIKKIDKIMSKDTKRPRDIRYIINCLFPGYSQLFERANRAMLEIGEPAVPVLIRAYPYKPCNEFGDFATCVYDLIGKIGGKDAEEFFRSEQER